MNRNLELPERRQRTITFEDCVYTNLPVDNWLFKMIQVTLRSLDFTIELVNDPDKMEDRKEYFNPNNAFFKSDNKDLVIVVNSLCRALYSLKTILRESVEPEKEKSNEETK